jgi:cytochrome c
MYDGGKIIIGLIIFLLLLLFPVWYQIGKAAKPPDPQLTEVAKKAETCIEPKSFMTTQHMKVLDQWRNEVVRQDERYYVSSTGKEYYKSLQLTCMECHANKTAFCDQCHNYMGVDPFCWDCHIAPKENP